MKIEIKDWASGELAKIVAQVGNRKEMMEAMGAGVEVALRKHFLKRNDEGNKKGWWSSNWWTREALNATSMQAATDTTATVVVASREFLHRLRGGTVKAASGKYLAIPLTSEAKRMGSPREWTDRNALFFLKTRKGAYLMRRKKQGRGKRRQERLLAYYVLKKSVTHKADVRALPEEGVLQGAAMQEARLWLGRLTGG